MNTIAIHSRSPLEGEQLSANPIGMKREAWGGISLPKIKDTKDTIRRIPPHGLNVALFALVLARFSSRRGLGFWYGIPQWRFS